MVGRRVKKKLELEEGTGTMGLPPGLHVFHVLGKAQECGRRDLARAIEEEGILCL